MTVRSVGAKLFHVNGWTDRQRDMAKLIVVFHNFALKTNQLMLLKANSTIVLRSVQNT